jgi:hypothetical protein
MIAAPYLGLGCGGHQCRSTHAASHFLYPTESSVSLRRGYVRCSLVGATLAAYGASVCIAAVVMGGDGEGWRAAASTLAMVE